MVVVLQEFSGSTFNDSVEDVVHFKKLKIDVSKNSVEEPTSRLKPSKEVLQ